MDCTVMMLTTLVVAVVMFVLWYMTLRSKNAQNQRICVGVLDLEVLELVTTLGVCVWFEK